jgi:hypothetical protein
MPVLTVFYVYRPKMMSVIIHYDHAATGPCDSEGGGKWPVSLNKSEYRWELCLTTRENLPNRLHDGSDIDEYILTERGRIRWVCDWW